MHNSRGFTLLEVLIALTIFGIVVVVIYGSLNLAIKAWERGETDAERNQETRIIADIIEQQVRSTYPYCFREGNEETPAFRGERQSARFISTIGLATGDIVGLVFVSYFIEPGKGLMLCEKRVFSKKMFEDESSLREESILLSSSVSEISFEYETEDGEWKEYWDIKEMLVFPRSMRITLEFLKSESGEKQATVLSIPLTAKGFRQQGIPG